MIHRQPCLGCALVATLIVAAPLPAGPACARRPAHRRHGSAPAPPDVQELGRDFETARALEGAARLTALEQLDARLQERMRGDAADDVRATLDMLGGAIAFERGDYAAAGRGYARALSGNDPGPFADDAAFARIRALEAAGHDPEAAREW